MRFMVDDRLDRILARRRFRRQHHGVGAVEDRGGDVGDFGAGRHRARDHRFQHLGRDHHRLAGAAAQPRHFLLHAGHFFQRHFDAEIAARHHQRVGEFENVAEPGDRLRLFDLGHHGGAAARDLLGLGDVFRPLNEGQRDPVDAGIERGFEIGDVLRRQRRHRNDGVGQADALAVRHFAADFDPRDDALRRDVGRDQAQLAVVDQQRVARLDRGEDFRMRQLHARGVARRRDRYRAMKSWPLSISAAPFFEGAEPQLRALQIDQDADRPVMLGFDRADAWPPVRACVSWVVWLILMRNTSAPASNSRAIMARSPEAGPSVATILVRRCRLIGSWFRVLRRRRRRAGGSRAGGWSCRIVPASRADRPADRRQAAASAPAARSIR